VKYFQCELTLLSGSIEIGITALGNEFFYYGENCQVDDATFSKPAESTESARFYGTEKKCSKVPLPFRHASVDIK
jgi:hypothetical protein